MTSTLSETLQFFAKCGQRYRAAYLSRIDVRRLESDRDYGLKAFLFQWAFERAGAPRIYRIAAVKAVSAAGGDYAEIPGEFLRYCTTRTNPRLNPVLDRRIADIDIPSVISLARDGRVAEAFAGLTMRGVGHKIRAFFLRDLVTLFDVEQGLDREISKYLWCQPIDVWVRTVARALGCPAAPLDDARTGRYSLSATDYTAARFLTEESLAAGVSPLRTNQGIWYFAANVVCDVTVLSRLIQERDPAILDAELHLLDGFLPG